MFKARSIESHADVLPRSSIKLIFPRAAQTTAKLKSTRRFFDSSSLIYLKVIISPRSNSERNLINSVLIVTLTNLPFPTLQICLLIPISALLFMIVGDLLGNSTQVNSVTDGNPLSLSGSLT